MVGADSGIKISSASNNRPHLRLECGTAEKLRLSANTLYGAIGDSSDTNRYMAFKDGNVSVNTVSPTSKFHVVGASTVATTKAEMNSKSVMKLHHNNPSTASTNMQFAGVGNGMGFQVTNYNDTANWDIYLNPFGGNVMIGSNATPSAKLHIGSSFNDAANDLGTAALAIKQTGTSAENGIYIERTGERKGYYIGITGVDGLTFRRNFSGTKDNVMVLTRDGNVGINKTPAGYGDTKLEVNGNVSGTRFLSGGTITNGTHAFEAYGSSFESSSIRLKEQGSGENEDPGILFQKETLPARATIVAAYISKALAV